VDPVFRLLRLAPAMAVCAVAVSCGDSGSTGPSGTTVASVSVSPASHTLTAIGATRQLTAVAQDAEGSTITGKTFVWVSGDTTVATVSSTGMVTAVANGSTDISASVDGKTGSASVTVAQAVVSVAVSSARDVLIMLGDTVTFSALVQDSRGNAVTGGTTLTWASSVPAIATIDSTGLATAVHNGTTNITATADGVSGTRVLVVRPTPVARLEMPDSADAGGQVTADLGVVTEGVFEMTGALVATLIWDPAVLQFNAASAAAIPYFKGYYDNTQGRARLLVSEPQGIGGNFTALAVTFDVVGASGASTNVSVSLDQLIAARLFRDFTSGAVGDDRTLIVR
jgi:hypothetical protein